VPSVYTSILLSSPAQSRLASNQIELSFVECNTELLACKRSDFLALGMLQDPTNGRGWPNWDDVDFGYRAHRSGFRLLRSAMASGEHWDYSISNRQVACRRWYRASKSAAWLFKRHDELRQHIPMLKDKTPLVWGQDSPKLIVRKVARRFMSSKPILLGMEQVVDFLERRYPSPSLLRRLYHWLQGAYMFQGHQAGLRELALSNP
jgi:GT2 family glycosyltransferase